MAKKLFDSYKSLMLPESNRNYLDILSLQILSNINAMKEMDENYMNAKIFLDLKDEKMILNSSFNSIKDFLWTKFCNQMRDYSDLIFGIISNDKSKFSIKKEYEHVWEKIQKSKFLCVFINGKKEYSALSLTLHNLSQHYFGDNAFKESFIIYDKFNEALKIVNINELRKDFEEIIFLLRKISDFTPLNVGLEFNKDFPIYIMLKSLTSKIK